MGIPLTEELREPVGRGYGDRSVLQTADFAVSSGLAYVVPGYAVLRPVSCVFILTTDANPASRYVTVEYRDPAGRAFGVSGAAVSVAASSTQRFAGSISRAQSEWNTGTDILFPLVEDFLDPGTTLAIVVGNIQAGDAFTHARVVVDRYYTGGDARHPAHHSRR